MAKQSYTENLTIISGRLSALETHIPHIENHLGNIDQHLNKLNERTQKNEEAIASSTFGNKLDSAVNRERISSNRDIVLKLGVPVCIAIVGAGISFILYLLGYIPF